MFYETIFVASVDTYKVTFDWQTWAAKQCWFDSEKHYIAHWTDSGYDIYEVFFLLKEKDEN